MTRPWQGVIRIVTVCYAAALTVGSLLPSGTETLRGWDAALTPDLQNALHAPAYAGLAVLGFLSLFRPGRPPVRIALLAAGAAIALGCALELAQLSVPGRTCSLPDGLMNGIGIIAGFLGILAWRWVSRRSERRQKARRVVRRHYHERGWSSPHIRYLNLLSSLMQKASVEVLDVGCGRTFPMAKLFQQWGARVHGVDPVVDPQAVPPGCTVKVGNTDRIPYPDASFDLLLSENVFEHLERPLEAFQEFHRVLRDGGRVVFLTPSRYDYVSLVARIVPNRLHPLILRLVEGRQEADAFPTFYRANCACQINRLAARAGFVVDRLNYVNHYPYLLTFSPLLCRVAIAYDEFIRNRRSLVWLQAALLGVLRKADVENTARKTSGEECFGTHD